MGLEQPVVARLEDLEGPPSRRDVVDAGKSNDQCHAAGPSHELNRAHVGKVLPRPGMRCRQQLVDGVRNREHDPRCEQKDERPPAEGKQIVGHRCHERPLLDGEGAVAGAYEHRGYDVAVLQVADLMRADVGLLLLGQRLDDAADDDDLRAGQKALRRRCVEDAAHAPQDDERRRSHACLLGQASQPRLVFGILVGSGLVAPQHPEAADLERAPCEQQRQPAKCEVVLQHAIDVLGAHETAIEQLVADSTDDRRLIPEQRRHRQEARPADKHLPRHVPAQLRDRRPQHVPTPQRRNNSIGLRACAMVCS